VFLVQGSAFTSTVIFFDRSPGRQPRDCGNVAHLAVNFAHEIDGICQILPFFLRRPQRELVTENPSEPLREQRAYLEPNERADPPSR